MKKGLTSARSAMQYVMEQLAGLGYYWRTWRDINEGRYRLLFGYPNILIMFKRSFFMTFGKQFTGESGVGETVNAEHLEMCKKHDVRTIITCYPDGKVYMIPTKIFLERAHFRTNEFEGKGTYSINIKYFERLNK